VPDNLQIQGAVLSPYSIFCKFHGKNNLFEVKVVKREEVASIYLYHQLTTCSFKIPAQKHGQNIPSCVKFSGNKKNGNMIPSYNVLVIAW
jgi:hypothetical protein